MAICPKCKKTIDDDGYYCEHCGEELYICPKCFPSTHVYGKGAGKRCGNCGGLLVAARTQEGTAPAVQQSAPAPQQSAPAPQQGYTAPQQGYAAPQQGYAAPQQGYTAPQQGYAALQQGYAAPAQGTAMPTPPQPTTLFCAAQNTMLMLRDGATIGRVQGDYVAQLSQFIYISGIHARVNMAGQQWTITDLGSRNGTKVNGVPCAPTLPIKKGDIVRLANFYDFEVK